MFISKIYQKYDFRKSLLFQRVSVIIILSISIDELEI